MMRWPAFVALAVQLLALPARGQEAPDLRALFPHEAAVFVAPPGGLTRVVLPPAVLAECRPDLSDLRLMDTQGREVPFRVDTGMGPTTRVEVTETVAGELLDVRREETRRETGPPIHRETYEVRAPATMSASGAWDLVVETGHAPFVRRIDVAAMQADGTRVPLLENGSLFRFADGRRQKIRVTLPSFSGTRLAVTLVGEDGFYLEPGFRFETARILEPRERMVLRLEEVSRQRAEGRTVLVLARPSGIVPDALRLETSTQTFDRTVEVADELLASHPKLGQATLFRVEAAAPVEEREVTIGSAQGERLLVTIHDGDSPALEELRVVAIVRQPSLIFSLQAGTEETPAAWLRYGGGRAHAPRYDLARLTIPASGLRATAAERLQDLAAIPPARLGEPRPNPHFDGTPVLAFAMRPGTVIDTRHYRHRRAIRVTPSREGLSRLRLGPDDLARAQPDLADIRIVDAEDQQWPYLLVSDATTEWKDVVVNPPTRKGASSRYRLALPVTPVHTDQLVLETDAPFFHRRGVLRGKLGDEEPRALSSATLVRRSGRVTPVGIAFRRARVDWLELEIEDGDDRPLAFRSARLRVPVTDLYLAAPPGRYFLLLGNPQANPPSYELERAREVVLAVASAPVVAEDTVPNPAYSARLRLAERTEHAAPQIVLWSVIALAVVGLTVLTLRLARSEGTPGGNTSQT
jgi:hypothetical protein